DGFQHVVDRQDADEIAGPVNDWDTAHAHLAHVTQHGIYRLVFVREQRVPRHDIADLQRPSVDFASEHGDDDVTVRQHAQDLLPVARRDRLDHDQAADMLLAHPLRRLREVLALETGYHLALAHMPGVHGDTPHLSGVPPS